MRLLDGERGEELREAARLLREGGVVALPTETVYGLAANAQDENAVRRVFEIKGRPDSKPLPVLTEGLQGAERLCAVSAKTGLLIRRFWPGALTLVLPLREKLCPLVTAGLETAALRCPAHPAALEVLRRAGVPLVLTSANRSGEKPPLCAAAVLKEFSQGEAPCAVVDGGICAVGEVSTILDMTGETPLILRQGGVSAEALRALLPEL